MESSLWFFYAVVTMLFWGVWGAFIERPEKNGFPATLGYAVWALTMGPCAVVAVAMALLAYQPKSASSPVKGRLWFVLALVVFLAWGIQAYVLRFANATMRSESIFLYMMLTGLLLVPGAASM